MKSKHLPEVASSLGVSVTGTLVVDTGLRELAGFTCSLAADADADVAGCTWEAVAQGPGETAKVTLKTWEDDFTTAGSTARLVSWIALGN